MRNTLSSHRTHFPTHNNAKTGSVELVVVDYTEVAVGITVISHTCCEIVSMEWFFQAK